MDTQGERLVKYFKLDFAPGINRDWTSYSNKGGWFDCDLIRFRNGKPETIGGWQKVTSNTFLGLCRNLFSWTTTDGSDLTAFGTSLKLYAEEGGVFTDITPNRTENVALASNPFSTVDTSTTVTVTHVSHGAIMNDFVTFSGAATTNGIPAAELNDEHQITTLIDSDTYEIEVTTAATSTASGGGASVLATYQINTGTASGTSGTGWGSGPWGGSAVRLSATVNNPLDTTNTSGTVVVNHTLHGASDGDYVILDDAAAIGGIDPEFLTGSFLIANSTANTYEITAKSSQVATSTVAGGGSFVSFKYFESTATGWGEAGSTSVQTGIPRYWTYDNFGEDLVSCPRNGVLYFWDQNGGTASVAISTLSGADSGVPTVAAQVLVSDARNVVAFATNPVGSSDQDRLLVRWSDSEGMITWVPDITNSAGELRIQTGSRFVTALETRAEILIFTDTSLSSMQYIGPPFFYGIKPVSSNISIWGPAASVTVNDTTYWMGRDNFYSYRGSVEPIPCTVWDKVFLDINFDNEFNVVAGTNRQFHEVIWFYPSESSTLPDRYVIYNYRDNIWYYGSIGRLAWIDTSFGNRPRAVDENNNYFFHDTGFDDTSQTPAVPLSPFILSSPLEIGDGDEFIFADKIIPDVTFRSSTNANPTATFSVISQDWPGESYSETDPEIAARTATSPIEQYTNLLHVRVRGRSMIFKVDSAELGTGWRVGSPRLRIRPDGGKS